ncbi:Melanoma receptor tyrosine-protein kinase [Geodia barretti]|uniref:Melanoma receptor tyrosine-protein kinase n=1 Tax=Geodia barretti TaxID=519541 RepID=A0AA35X1X0_GEOBA|nr:Melanoma receptor tyrosine-protein kinase [Geodia barretti]
MASAAWLSLVSSVLENTSRKPYNTACSDDMYLLLLSCWNAVPQQRPRFCEIVSKIDVMMEEKFGYLRMNTNCS